MQLNHPEFWIDVNLPPSMAQWLKAEFGVEARSFHEMNLLTASDHEVYKLALQAKNVIIITTKDIDFVQNIQPYEKPRLLLISTGNISKKDLKLVFQEAFPQVLVQLTKGNHHIIEITR